MKKIFWSLAFLVTLSSCRISGVCLDEERCKAYDDETSDSQGACAKTSIEASWKSSSGEVVTFDEDCDFKRSACGMAGKYPSKVSGGSFVLDLTTLNANGSLTCPKYTGNYNCTYNLTSTGTPKLELTCVSSKAASGDSTSEKQFNTTYDQVDALDSDDD